MREKIEGLRRCGSCSECCIALSVKEIEKPSMVRCESVCSAGCRVYESRPESCKSFECLWLMGAGSNADRPDRIGAVFSVEDGVHGENLVKVFLTRDNSVRAKKIIDDISQRVVVYLIGRSDSRGVRGPADKVEAFFSAIELGGGSREEVMNATLAREFVKKATPKPQTGPSNGGNRG